MNELKDNKAEINSTLKEMVLQKCSGVKPHSKWHFLYQEGFMWVLWLFSVLVGSLATAVILYVLKIRHFSPYFVTHDSFFWFLADTLPYIWLVLLALMSLVAVYNVKCTNRGYKHPLSLIMLSSLVLSVGIGTILQTFGFGFTVDRMLGNHMPMYISQQKFEQRLWQSPAEGRLIGRQVLSTVAPTSTIVFEDIDGNRWNFCVSELSENERDLLASEKTLRIVGTTTVSGAKIFHACGILSFATVDQTMKHLDEERKEFIARAREHIMMRRMSEPVIEEKILSVSMNDESLEAQEINALCPETMMVKRLEKISR